jgi:anti-sigma regulatory factor (Ser/Thr protein kinase)
MVCTSAGGRGLAHHGLLHPESADLPEIVAPLVAPRLARGESVLGVLPGSGADALRAKLPTQAGLHTREPSTLYRYPARVLGHYLTWIADNGAGGAPLTIVAVPDLSGDDAQRVALWLQIDAVTTLALAGCALTLVCAYPDDPALATRVRGAHPSMLNGAPKPNPEHLAAEDFLASYPLPPPPELGEPILMRTLACLPQLAGLRQLVATHASCAGLPQQRCDDFVLAVNEVASNAIEHGRPPATVRLWITPASVICEVSDAGRIVDPLAGLLPPNATQRRGRGLWMAYQLCDQLYLWPNPTTIRLQIDRPDRDPLTVTP